jgi:GNAT superfamily N-acetyltransferase
MTRGGSSRGFLATLPGAVTSGILTSADSAGNVVTTGRGEAAGLGEAVQQQMADTADAEIRVVPANEASWDDLQAVMGRHGEASRCQCQWFKIRDKDWQSVPVAERSVRLRAQTGCGSPDTRSTSGLIAYLGGEPAGWCAVEPRTAYVRLLRMRVPWAARTEDKNDDAVWAVTCFVTRTGFRRRGISRALARAAVDFARERGARAIEGYPMITQPGQEFSWGELYVGSRSIFAEAGFTEVSRPTLRRVVMRIDL